MDELDWPDRNDDEYKLTSELSPIERDEQIDRIVHNNTCSNTGDPFNRLNTLHYRILRSIAISALDCARTKNLNLRYFKGLARDGFDLESQLRYAVTADLKNGDPARDDYWTHHDNPVKRVRQGYESKIYRGDVEQVAADYLLLSYRVPEFERLLVDILIATEMYAYFSEALGEKAKPNKYFGFVHPASLIAHSGASGQ